MHRYIRDGLCGAGFVVALAVGFAASALAGPVSPAGASLKAAVPAIVTDIGAQRRASKKHRRVYHGHATPHGYQRPYDPGPFGPGNVDTVGSLGHDGYGYAYNRFSGQRYFSCMIDEGYGRVRPCDAGGRR